MKEAVTIIVPVLDREDLITRCLDSIFNQSYRPIRLIVVDNGSTDSTRTVAFDWLSEHRSEDFSTILLSEPTPKASNARNCGLKNVETEKVMFFDSDDTMNRNCIEKAMGTFTDDPDCDVAVWRARMHLLSGQKRVTRMNRKKPFYAHLIHGLLRPQGIMLKTSLAIEAGCWNPALTSWDDLEFGVRIMLLNPKIIFIDDILTDIYSQEKSITGTSFLASKGTYELALHDISQAIAGSNHPDKPHLRRLVAYRTMILGAIYHREGDRKAGHILLETALKEKSLNCRQRISFILAYHYTRLGGRGAYRFLRI